MSRSTRSPAGGRDLNQLTSTAMLTERMPCRVGGAAPVQARRIVLDGRCSGWCWRAITGVPLGGVGYPPRA